MASVISTAEGSNPHEYLRQSRRTLNWWSGGAIILAALAVMPVAAVLIFAFGDSGDIWEHLVKTSLFGYVKTTLWLMLGVGVSVFVTGVSTAWVVTMCPFPGRKVFEWLLLLPLAMPAYVIAYAYTDFLEYAGPVQGLLRAVFGWQSARDYLFPEIRSLGGAIMTVSYTHLTLPTKA